MSGMQNIIDQIETMLAWVPLWILGLALLAAAIVVALLVHGVADRMLRRALARQRLAILLVERTRGPVRLALIILAARLAVGSGLFNDATVATVGRALSLAFIALLGWITVRAIDIGATLYLLRFRLDVQDNLLARKHVTQVRVLRRALETLVVIITVSAALMTFDSVRQYGVSLFASAGVAGLVVGLAARPVFSNLIAGIQLAVTQPIRIDDAVIVENEWGWIEEITATYVVVRLWDWRRLVVPLTYFIEKPFQNWTRETASLIGSVMLYVDYAAPVDRIRQQLEAVVKQSKLWDGQVVNLQVTDAREGTVELRALVSAANASATWDLRCEVREKLLAYLREELPHALPRARGAIEVTSLPDAMSGPTKRRA
jgi:small-conductance mechanosensitive channel